MRVFIEDDPFCAEDAPKDWGKRGRWPCKWIAVPGDLTPPFVTAYRRRFTLNNPATIRIHVTADERYELFVDGERIGRGSERGDRENWYFETCDLRLSAGEHIIVARVWAQGEKAAFAQHTVWPGFLLAPQDEEHIALLGTGVAEWEAKRLGGYTFTNPLAAWGTGENFIIDGAAFDWGFERGEGNGWEPVSVLHQGFDAARINEVEETHHRLRPATLPPMMDEPRHVGTVRLVADLPEGMETNPIPIRAADNLPNEQAVWQRLIAGESGSLTIPAHTRRRVLLDLENYYCAYPEIVTTGGAGGTVRVHWQESLFEANHHSNIRKGNRDEIEGKHFTTIWRCVDGIGDTFLPDGGQGRRFSTLWWQCGRYVEIVVEAKDEPLTIDSFTLRETRYPVENESEFTASDPRLAEVVPIAVRTLQMCSHETYMDCPYFEQLQYIGDTRLQALVTFAITHDERLARKALSMFDASRMLSGLTQSRYPSRVRQIIPPFSLWYVAMVHDYARWRDDPAFVRSLLPGVRGVMDYFLSLKNEDGLIAAPQGWNFMDWVPEWKGGIPPDGHAGVSGVFNWQAALVLTQWAELEEIAGQKELAGRARREARELAGRIGETFWDEGRGLFTDDRAKENYSEHAQCLALLSGLLSPDRQRQTADALLSAPDLKPTTIYFTHYLFETYRLLRRTDRIIERMGLWFDHRKNGLRTTIEMPEPTRSDCHAWGAHPVFHYFATILGIRPAEPGFRSVLVAPLLGPLDWAKGTMPHPNGGEITVDARCTEKGLEAKVVLPEGVIGGVLRWAGQEEDLQPGEQTITIEGSEETALPPRFPQLQMLWPERLLEWPPIPVLADGYRLRQYTDADETAYVALMEGVGFGRWEHDRVERTRQSVLPGGFFVVEHGESGAIVATALATHHPTEQHPEGGELSWVAGDGSHKGKGLGKAVVAAATARLIAAGYRRIYLYTDDFRLPALKVYLDLGYEPHLFTEGMTERWEKIHEALGRTV